MQGTGTMFRLRATLIATTLMRPWRTGWSVDQGVDFSLASAASQQEPREDNATAERTCFIEEDWSPPPDASLARTLPGLAPGGEAEPAPEDSADAGMLRGWWSVAGKPSRT